MYPDMRRLGYRYKDITIRWVEERNNAEFEVNAFPSLIYRDVTGAAETYNGGRSYGALREYLNSK
jgi:hypothetical protein